jgi:hypothetical protein
VRRRELLSGLLGVGYRAESFPLVESHRSGREKHAARDVVLLEAAPAPHFAGGGRNARTATYKIAGIGDIDVTSLNDAFEHVTVRSLEPATRVSCEVEF